MSVSKKLCFVIMPFSETTPKHTEKYWTDHFRNFLKPLLEEGGQLEVRRSEPLAGDILKQIITNLVVSPIVVADLTDLNPNVFWELGVRQSFKHGTITIAEEGTTLPFDVFGKGTLVYHDSHIGNEQFCSDFKRAITHCLNDPNSPDSSVLETLSGRGTLFEIIHQAEMLRRLDALIEEHHWNRFVLEEVIQQVKDNIKKPQAKQWLTKRFMWPAVEFLLIDRYLDEDKSFYEIASTYCTSIHALDHMLRHWDTNNEVAETWFEKYGNMYIERFEKHKQVLTAAQKRLSKKVLNTVI